MSGNVFSKIWEDPPCGGTSLLVLLALADSAQHTGEAWFKAETVARHAAIEPDQVLRHLRALEDAGIIEDRGDHYLIPGFEDEGYTPGPSAKPIPMAVRKAVIERDFGQCVYCGTPDGPFHIDHVHPRSRGGSDEIDNLALACAPCNISKGAKTLEEWRP